MIAFLKRLCRDKRGNVLAVVAAAMPLVIGGAGLATDTIQWTLWKRQLQRAADSAAVAGVYDREAANGSTATTSTAVSRDLSLNNHSSYALKAGFPQVTFPANSGVKTNQVAVTIAVQHRLSFSSFFMSTPPTITATATAASIPAGGSACIEALVNTANATGITNNGNTTVSAPNCILYSNSPSVNSASAGGSSSVTAKSIAAVGGIAQSNNWHVQQYLPYSPTLADPFASVTPDPNAMNCSAAALDEGTTSVAAGINCFASLSVKPNKTLNLDTLMGTGTKTVYINGGSIDLKGTLTCTNCTIVLTNKNTAANATIGTFSSNAQASNNITAPTSGTYSGIAVYKDRRGSGQTDKINGGSSNVIQGALYFPKSTLWINGSGNTTSLCAMFIAWQIVFTGNSSISINSPSDSVCASSGLPLNSSVKMIRLVS